MSMDDPQKYALREVYAEATELAMENNQMVGEKGDLYVTLAQLERLSLRFLEQR